MHRLLAIMIAFLGGLSIGTQPSLNASLGKIIGVMEAALISITITFISILACVLAFGQGQLSAVTSAQPYQLLGGVLGAVFVLVSIVIVPVLGAATTLGVSIVGQLLAVIIIDHFGLFGLPRIPFDFYRFIGILLLLIGSRLILK